MKPDYTLLNDQEHVITVNKPQAGRISKYRLQSRFKNDKQS